MGTAPAPRLFLIDGYALIYRAFFAMIGRPLRTSKGENTSAVWGVANFLHRLFEQHRPAHVAWVHDAGSSFREEVFPEYKATREKLDEELQDDFDRSLDRIEDLLEAFGVPLVAVDGYEADDVIGTLAAKATDEGMSVVIVSGDKDFYQLISPSVSLLNPGRRGPAAVDEQWVDMSNADERLGVRPNQVVDYLALVGDSSDNIPGVKGVGAKTAQKLLAEYGDLDTILEHAGDVSGKRAREALLGEADNARLSRDLVTIHRDVPVDTALDALVAGEQDVERLQALYAELEFHSLLAKVEAPLDTEEAATEFVCTIVASGADVNEAVAAMRASSIVAIQVFASSQDPLEADVVGVGAAVPDGPCWYFPLAHRAPDGELGATDPPNLGSLDSAELVPLASLLEDAGVAKVAHDAKHAWLVLRRAGAALAGVVCDTVLASFLIDPGRRSHDVDVLALEHFNERIPNTSDVIGKGRTARPVAEVTVEQAAALAGHHAAAVLALRDFFEPQLDQLGLRKLLEELELPLVKVLVDMEWRGIGVDLEGLDALSREFGVELRRLESAIHDEAGTDFNINSTQQLRHVLFEKLGLPVLKRTKTGPSTDADVLTALAAMDFALPKLMLDYREVSKLQSTYVDALPQRVNAVTGRIHTRFSQTGAATGRLSSSDPNLQNIPIRTPRGEQIRRCFVPADGHLFIVADYSQIELRLLAHLSEDPAFLEAFRRGGDVHRETAAIIFDVPLEEVTGEMRARAKTINFATIYGQGAFALARQLGIPQDEARDFIDLYFERFAGVRAYLDDCVRIARDRGYAETLFGRRRYIPELKDRNFNIRAFGERVAMNSPLQGSAADLIKHAMLRIDAVLAREAPDSATLLQVHDELVVESPEDGVDATVGIVKREMEQAATLAVPLVVDVGVGPNCLEAKA
jgi:DNA polymerase-1